MKSMGSTGFFWLGNLLLALFLPILVEGVSTQLAIASVLASILSYLLAWSLHADHSTKAAGQPDKWLPLGKALKYLAYDSRWARKAGTSSDEPSFDRLLSAEFREHLARGDIRSRGKKADASNLKEVASEPINPEYWQNSFFQPGAEIYQADPNRGALTRGRGASDSYRAVVINANDLVRIWPKVWLSRLRKRPRITDSIEPMRKIFLDAALQRGLTHSSP